MLGEIKRGVVCYRLSIGDILNQFYHDTFSQTDFIKESLSSDLDRAFAKHKELFGYDMFCEKKLTSFFLSFGSFTVSEQLLACEEILEILENEYETKKTGYPNQRKLYLTLGATIGLGIVILLV